MTKIALRQVFDRYGRQFLIPVIILLGTGIRLWGIGFGLPYVYHPDEPSKISAAQRILKTGDLNPHYYLKPPFYVYVNAAAYLPYIVLHQARGVPADVTIQGLQTPIVEAGGTGISTQPLTVLIGRGMSVWFGSLSILLVYLLALKVSPNWLSAAATAFFVAVSPELSSHSRLITPDILVVCFCLLTVYFSVGVYQRGRPVDYVLAGIAGALAASAKYEPVIVLIVPAVAHVLANGLRGSLRNKRLFISVLTAIITFVALNPPIVFDFAGFYRGVTKEGLHYSTGHFGMEGGSFGWYLGYFWWREGLMAVLGLIGMIWYAVRHPKMGILLLTFPVVYLGFSSSFIVRNDRTALPITPFLYIFAVQLLFALWQSRPPGGLRRAHIRIAVLGATALMLAFSIMSAAQDLGDLLSVDARETSALWIAENIGPHAKIAIESYAPFIENSSDRLVVIGRWARLIDHDLAWFQQEGFEYVVASRGSYGRYLREPIFYKDERHAYRRLFSQLELVKEFDDTRREPWIYEKLRAFRDRAKSSQFWDGFMQIQLYRVPPVSA